MLLLNFALRRYWGEDGPRAGQCRSHAGFGAACAQHKHRFGMNTIKMIPASQGGLGANVLLVAPRVGSE